MPFDRGNPPCGGGGDGGGDGDRHSPSEIMRLIDDTMTAHVAAAEARDLCVQCSVALLFFDLLRFMYESHPEHRDLLTSGIVEIIEHLQQH